MFWIYWNVTVEWGRKIMKANWMFAKTLVQFKIICSHQFLHMTIQNCVSFISWKHFNKRHGIIIFAYLHIYVNIQREKSICEEIVKKLVRPCYLLLITLSKSNFADQFFFLHWMHASGWNFVGGFRKITRLFWGMTLENEYVALFRLKK